MKRFLMTLALSALAAFAADVSGNWKATAEGPNGAMERTFSFKVDGDKLTGETVSSMMGKSVIENGKVQGDEISFTINIKFQDNEMKMNYKGKLTGDTMKLTAERAGGEAGQAIEWTAKRGS
ncbi:hypothetical protein [uncultured Paludibaculum sp.]|uniref:hypothetical protein n=1 Tax=uncultured Paludibaculum sp. TaxID=1765020 RepID=UPI002AAB6BA8|nr:hypothetical protein [uncultured Paludibaculum sp.]